MSQQISSPQFKDEPNTNHQQPSADPTNTPTQSGSKLNTNFYERTRTTIYMILSFIVIISAGQIYCVLLVQFLNTLIFMQINNIKRNQQKQIKIPMTKFINWYLFMAFNYYSLGKFIAHKLPYLGIQYPIIGQLLTYHNFICFSLFVVGFLSFVLSLKQGFLKYQFRLFGWIVISVLLVCAQAWSMCKNIYEGLIWFVLPVMLVVVNDIFAYLFGYFLGKHQLIALSPKKTWQGYIGGVISTCLFSIILTESLQTIDGMVCPGTTLSFWPFSYPICDNSVLDPFTLGPLVITKLQAHFMLFSLFASIIGPFGGFFASGLKRSIKIKDFGNSIPGHGGVSDRMDCQLIMGAFVYFYHQTFIKVLAVGASTSLLALLSTNQQLELFQALKQNLNSLNLI